MKPDRVVIGGSSTRAIDLMLTLYKPFVRTENPIMVMDNRSAEMTKYAANAFLATRISFINEIANLCERVGADVRRRAPAAWASDRSHRPPLPSFPASATAARASRKTCRRSSAPRTRTALEFPLLNAVEHVNETQKRLLVEKVAHHFGDELKNRRFAIWGLAFKSRTDDMREAPSIVVIEELLRRGAVVEAHDPEALNEARKVLRRPHSLSSAQLRRASKASMRCSSSPTGTSSAAPDFKRHAVSSCARRSSSTAAISTTTMRYASTGFTYYPIGRPALEIA